MALTNASSAVKRAAPKTVVPLSPFGSSANSGMKPLPAAPPPPPAAPVSPFTAAPTKPAFQTLAQPISQPAAPQSPFVQPPPVKPAFSPISQPIDQPLPYTSGASAPAPAPPPAPAPQPQGSGSGYGAAFGTVGGSFNQGGSTGGVGTGGSQGGGTRPSGEAAPPVPERSTAPRDVAPPPSRQYDTRSGINSIFRTDDNLIGPGTYENWFKENQGAFTAPSALDDYWNGVKGTLTGQRFQPSYSADAYGGYRDAMTAPSQGVTNAQQIAGLSRNRGTGENMMAQAGDMFRGNTGFQDYAGQQLQSGWFNQAGNAQQYYDQSKAALGKAGAGYNNAMGVLGGMNYGQQAINQLGATAGGAQNVQNLYNEKFPQFLDRNASGSEYDYFSGNLRGPSYSEDLYESGNEGLNTYYDRARKKGLDSIEDRMAAAGTFGSGDTATAMYELEGELGASQARDMASLAQQADAARIARGESARGWAGQIGDEDVSRMNLGVEAANSADVNRLALMGRQMEGYNLASNEANQRAGRYLEADEGERARMQLGGNMAQQADQEGRLRRQLGLDTSRFVGEANDRNARGFFDTGQGMSTAEDRRLNTSLDAGLRGDQESRLRQDNAFNASLDMEEQERSWFDRQQAAVQTEGNLAGQVSSQQLARLQGQGAAADRSQQSQENRLRNRLSDIRGATNDQVDALMKGLDEREKADLNLAISEIDSRVAQLQMNRQEAQQKFENAIKKAETGMNLMDAFEEEFGDIFSGGGGGGGGGGGYSGDYVLPPSR